MREALAQSFDEADLSVGPPSVWSKVSAAVLLEGLLLYAEKQGGRRFLAASLSTRIGYGFIRVWVSFTIGSGGVPPRLRIFLLQKSIGFIGARATLASTSI